MSDYNNNNAEEEIEFEGIDEDENTNDPFDGQFSPMIFKTMQRKVRDLNSDYTNKELDPRPSFQRGYVWDKSRASKLIESILLNVPLPLIYTAEEPDGMSEVVIDGQQRLLSVFGYIQGKFPKDGSKFRLNGLKLVSGLNGKSYDDLDQRQQKAIQGYIFQVIQISSDSHADVKFEIFERLNSGSVTLNAQELRNCVYRGVFNETLKKLSENADFQAMIGTSMATSRMQDAELALRFLAFYEKTYLNYTGSMKSFLNSFMNDFKDLSPQKAEDFENAFKNSAALSRSVFGAHAFRKFKIGSANQPNGVWETAINRPLFDVVMWGFSRFEKSDVMRNLDAIREALIDLLTSDARFLDTITSAVGDKGKTTYRFETWKKTLEDTIVPAADNSRLFGAEVKKRLFSNDPMCALCLQQIHSLDDCHVDHVVPFSKGGLTQDSNAQLAHRFCNLKKSNGD